MFLQCKDFEKNFCNAVTSRDYIANPSTYMEVQETITKTQMKLFQRVNTKHKFYYPCTKKMKNNPNRGHFIKWL